MRRGWLARLGRVAAVAVVAACALAWIIGRVFSDRYAWSQPISWIPTPLLAVPIWMALVGAATRELKRRAVVRRASGRGMLGLFRAPLTGTALLAMTAATAWHFAFVELGLHRAAGKWGPLPAPASMVAESAEAPTQGPLRIVFWNQASADVGEISGTFLATQPAVLVLANRHSGTSTRDLAQSFIDTGPAYGAVGWPFDVFARVPIRRWASTSLGLEGRSRRRDGSMREDGGSAAFYQIETPSGLLTIWAVDLPSDPSAARAPLARAAGGAIASWSGSVRIVDPGEGQRFERFDGLGFPAPDLIVGDFNIPRGSASLREFLAAAGAPSMRDAFDEAGWGWDRTWPRRFPVWAIDQCFVGPRVRAMRFGTFEPGGGGHRALLVELAGP